MGIIDADAQEASSERSGDESVAMERVGAGDIYGFAEIVG